MDILAAEPPSPGGFGGIAGGDGGGGGGSPCQRRDIREWQHLDPRTGDRLRARLQADRWIVGQAGRYDKVVDSRDITAADGRSHTQHKQLEMLQARTAQGSVQVVRTRTVSSARWSSDHISQPPPAHTSSVSPGLTGTDYKDLQLPVHPLDLSTQRERAEIGRNGSIASRRPPTRTREPQTQHNIPAISDLSRNKSLPASQRHFETIDSSQSAEQKEIYRSNSTEDLSSLEKFNDEYEQVGEWRRVSKIRRSLQLHGRSSAATFKPRPVDLPNISGCVSKIRRELENNASAQQPIPVQYVRPKRHTFVAMGSLQEVRDCSKKLTIDEMSRVSEAIVLEDENDDGIVVRAEDSEPDTKSGRVRSYIYGMESTTSNGTGSLESRRARDTEDWHARRKSYGFEGMLAAAPVSTAMVRSDTSTDSGICRSTELTNNLFEGRSTVVTLGEESDCLNGVTTIPVTLGKTSTPNHNGDMIYRQHSEEKEESFVKDFSDTTEIEEDVSLIAKKNKKVEFCKTEVHFAADSGRVNIVETDGKPPPTQNFRRRRRATAIGAITSPESKANLPIIHFGDDEQNKLSAEINGETENSFRNVVMVKPIRPRSFHMGDTSTTITDGVWGVKLRHVSPIHNGNASNEIQSPKSPTSETNKFSEIKEECKWSSVAERVRAVEHRRSQGFSTKVNFGSGEPIVETRGSAKGRITQEWNPKSPSDPVVPRVSITRADIADEVITSPVSNKNSAANSAVTEKSYPVTTKPKIIEIETMPSLIDRKNSLRRSLERDKIISMKPSISKLESSKFPGSNSTQAKTLHPSAALLKSPRPSPTRSKSPRPSPTKARSPKPSPTRSKSPLLEVAKSGLKREKTPNKEIKRSSRSPSKIEVTPTSPAVSSDKLKTGSSGYRQLTERELKYFGVKINKSNNERTPENSVTSTPTTSKKKSDKVDYVNLPGNKQKMHDSSEKNKSKITSPIYQNVHDIDRLHKTNSNKINQNDSLKQIMSQDNDPATDEKSPAITETPKGRGRGRIAEDKLDRCHNGDNQRRFHNTIYSKGLTHQTSPTKKSPASSSPNSTEHLRNRKSLKESSPSTTMSPEKRNGTETDTFLSKQEVSTVKVNSDIQNSRCNRRHHMQRVSSREALLEATRDSSDEEQNNTDALAVRRHRRHERSCDRRAPLPEYHHKTVTSTIKSVAEKAAAKKSERHTRMEQNGCGNDLC